MADGNKPSTDLILLALFLHGKRQPVADEVRGMLVAFGYDLTAQHVAASLGRLSREECPTVAVSESRWGPGLKTYELTRFGRTELGNHWPRLWPVLRTPELR